MTVSNSPETDRAAAINVCGRAKDKEDATLLLSVLGLLPEEEEDGS